MNTLAVTESTDVTSVRFRDATGARIGEAEVTPSLDPVTQVLPEIQDAR